MKLTDQQSLVLGVLKMGNFTEWEINNRLVISSTGQRVSELRVMGFVIDSVKQEGKRGHLLVLKSEPEGVCDFSQSTNTAPSAGEDQELFGKMVSPIPIARNVKEILTENGEEKTLRKPKRYAESPKGNLLVITSEDISSVKARGSKPEPGTFAHEKEIGPTYATYKCEPCGTKFFIRSDKKKVCPYCGNVKLIELNEKGKPREEKGI